jgi:predicted hydrocarbon binding protein
VRARAPNTTAAQPDETATGKNTDMKGIIFTTFNDMVEREVGIDVWEDILESVNPESGGVYTAVEDFPDEELIAMIMELSAKTSTPAEELVVSFGQYLFHVLAIKHSIFVQQKDSFLEFLKSVEDVIHKEVEKLYPNPNLPSLRWEQPDDNTLVLYYKSPRKMCQLALGLIEGAAEHYKVDYDLAHETCMHEGHDHCRLNIKLV